jgi:hypothetical protein
MDAVYVVPVGDVVLRIRQVRDEMLEQWMCEAVVCGTRLPVKVIPERVAVNRDRLLLAGARRRVWWRRGSDWGTATSGGGIT